MTYLINKKPHRISAGGILIHENKVLLVEYNSEPLGNYFVAPGGGMEDGENTIEAIKRELLEETNLVVEPQNVVLIEDLDTKNYKMIKIWMTCHYINGEIKKTSESISEGKVSAKWYSRKDINEKSVYPYIIKEMDWSELIKINNVIYIPTTKTARF